MIDELKDLGFVSYTRKTETRKNFYTIHYEKIKQKVHLIYDFSELNEIDRKGFKQAFRNFFDYHQISGYYDDNSILEADEAPNPGEHKTKSFQAHTDV